MSKKSKALKDVLRLLVERAQEFWLEKGGKVYLRNHPYEKREWKRMYDEIKTHNFRGIKFDRGKMFVIGDLHLKGDMSIRSRLVTVTVLWTKGPSVLKEISASL